VKLTLSVAQTSDSRKTYKRPKEVRSELQRSAADVIASELPSIGEAEINVVFMTDPELLALNIASLGHDWYTDIITFEIDRSVDRLEAELYLSVDRALENARKAKISLERELVHLVIHGILHLAGYDDHGVDSKKLMKRRERFYLARMRKF
jgi:probable rRNA maturation factor